MAWGKADQSHPDTPTAGTSKPGFFSSFGRKKKTLHVKKTDDKKLTKSRTSPRGGKQSLPAFTVIRPQRSFSNRPKPASVIHASAVPRIFPDDPAFSSDPRVHPHFSAVSDANSRRSSARSQASHTGRSGGTASRAQTQKGTPETDDLHTPPNPRIPHAPSASSHSSGSSTTKTSSAEAHTTSGTSAHSSHESAPMAAKLKKFSVVNPEELRPDLPRSTSATSNPPPPYEPSIVASQEGSAEVPLRPNVTRGSSAPEFHHPISQIAPPPRPTTAPAEDRPTAPPLQQRTETNNTSGAPRARDLDRIDELDESDPFGAAIHHRGPYEAIQAILGNPSSNVGGHEGRAERGPDRKPRSQRTAYAQPYPGMPMFDPHMKLDLKPGQILPRIPFYDPETLPQTPYHRQHRSVSAVPSQPSSVAAPRRHKSERAPQHFPQQQHHATQSDVGHGQHPSGPRYPRPLRESLPQSFARNPAPPMIRIDASPSLSYPDEHQPSSQYHLQPPPNQPHPRTRSQSEQGHAQPQQRPQQSQPEYGHSQLQQRPQLSQSEHGHSQVQQRPQQPQSEHGHSQLQQQPQSEHGHSQLQQRPQQSQSEHGHSQLQQRPQQYPAHPPSLQPSNLLVPGHNQHRPQQYPTHSPSPQASNQPVPPQIQHRSQQDKVLPPSLQPSNPAAPQIQQRPRQDRTVPPSLQPSNQLAPPQVQQQPRPQQYQVPPAPQRPILSPVQPQPPQQQSRPQQHQVHAPVPQPPTLASESQGPQQQRRPQQYQTHAQEQQQQQQYHQQPPQAQTSQQPSQTRPRHKSEHSRSQPRPSDHGHHDPNINAVPQLLVPGQPMSSAHSSRQSSQTPSIAPSKTVSTAHSSQRSGQSQSVLTPLHVPKRLVMPSPLGTAPSSIAPASMNHLSPASYYQAPLPRLPLPQQQPQQQQQHQQHFPLPPLQNQGPYQPMAQDVLMTTEAHQLMRKRTASQPVHVPLGEMRLGQSNTTVHFLPPLHKKDRPTERRLEKTGNRLSKRRVVVPV